MSNIGGHGDILLNIKFTKYAPLLIEYYLNMSKKTLTNTNFTTVYQKPKIQRQNKMEQ